MKLSFEHRMLCVFRHAQDQRGRKMMSSRRAFLVGALLAASGATAQASTGASAQISAITSATEGLASIVHPGTRTGLPACATSTVWSINLTSPGGQSTFSAVLTAYIVQRPISIAGTGTCNAYGQQYVGYVAM